jgi:dihydroorotate dehydrogenase
VFSLADRLARQILHAFDSEDAHRLVLKGLRLAPLPAAAPDDPRLRVEAFGLSFANPIGTAAGFDKNAELIDAVPRLGFGFAEIGTVTPRPQPGNPRPRLFRLREDAAAINRLGFNNAGHVAVAARLAVPHTGIVGVNVGANKDSGDRAADYAAGIAAFAGFASYFTINISSPNTPGLRDLQQAAALDGLLARVLEARAAAPRHVPVLLKIAPDLALQDLDDIIAVTRRHAIDGLVVANTTVTRPARLRDRGAAQEAGGLSGRPLFDLSTRVLAETFLRVQGAFPLVGVGGIDSGAAALAKIRAGAALIQLYTGLLYRGFSLIKEIKQHLVTTVARDRLSSIGDVIGLDAAARSAESWPD